MEHSPVAPSVAELESLSKGLSPSDSSSGCFTSGHVSSFCHCTIAYCSGTDPEKPARCLRHKVIKLRHES
jgi:hypothetical protein